MNEYFRRMIALVALILACAVAPALAERRVALVIGNGAYRNAIALPNPSHDAEDVAAALKRIGFDVILGANLDKAGMDEHAIRFARAAREADVALFYYSGHAMQSAGVNYLMPVNARLSDEADLRRMMRVDDIIDDLQQAKNLRILVLDSCRDNPLAEQLRRSAKLTRAAAQSGLAKIDGAQGMIVAYATQAGRTADDGTGRNSPYTAAFLRHIEAQDEIGTIFRRIAADVYQATGSTQLPELSLSLVGEFYLRSKPPAAVAGIPPVSGGPCAEAEVHWRSAEQIRTRPAFEDHLARFPGCAYAGLAKARIAALSQPGVTEPRESSSGSMAPALVESGVVGRWEIFMPNQRGVARWIWEISPNGLYAFRSEGRGAAPRHEGTIGASDGRWTLRAQRGLPGWEDGGSYEVRDGNTLVIAGRLGTGAWRRVDGWKGSTAQRQGEDMTRDGASASGGNRPAPSQQR
jgi:hypothetical protein